MTQEEQLTKIVEDAAKALGEHFEAVQIMVSNSDSEGTAAVNRGAGNFYARLAMAQEFLDNDRAAVWAKIFDERLNKE